MKDRQIFGYCWKGCEEDMVKAVIFDLDNTLYDYTKNNQIARQRLAETAAGLLDVTPERFLEVYAQADREVKARMGASASCHNRMLFCQRAVEMLGGNVLEVTPKLYEAYWGTILAEMKLYPGAEKLIKALKDKGILIGICTDMTAHIQYRKLQSLGLTPYVDAIVTSEEMGVEKPHAAMFHAILDKLKVRSGEAVYVGDNFERDICGAQNTAIRPIWFVADRPHEEQEGLLTIQDFEDLRLWQACGI